MKVGSTEQGDRTLYRFEAVDVPRLIPEPNMPGWAEVASPLHLSTYQNWEQVGRYYWGLVRDQLVPNEELKKAVETALKGVDRKDEAKVVAALYGFVVTNTRYVALEFGIHGYKPYRVDRILARKFGDCKDKASLIHAMLKVAGVDSRLVLLRMRHLGTLSPEVASLAAFNHAIAYVPKLDLYLDGTAEFHGSRELASADRVANVLIIEPDAPSRFLTTPEAQPEDNTTSLALDVTLKVDGSASAKGTLVAKGQGAPEMRRTYQTPATRVVTFEQQWAQSYPGVQASEVMVSDTEGSRVAAVGEVRHLHAAVCRGGRRGCSGSSPSARAARSPRRWPRCPSGAWTWCSPACGSTSWRRTTRCPANWNVAELPPEVFEESPFGSLRIVVSKNNGKLKVTGKLVMSRARITAKEYPDFRSWLLKVDQAFSRKIVAQQGGQTASR